MKTNWELSALNDCGYLTTDDGSYAHIVKLEQGWRWEVHQPSQLIVDMDGWWGIVSTAEEAMGYAEKKLGIKIET